MLDFSSVLTSSPFSFCRHEREWSGFPGRNELRLSWRWTLVLSPRTLIVYIIQHNVKYTTVGRCKDSQILFLLMYGRQKVQYEREEIHHRDNASLKGRKRKRSPSRWWVKSNNICKEIWSDVTIIIEWKVWVYVCKREWSGMQFRDKNKQHGWRTMRAWE